MSYRKYHLRSSLFGALGFGLGFFMGGLLTYFIYASQLGDSLLNLLGVGRLAVGIILILLVAGLGGAVGGAIGSLTLNYAYPALLSRRGFAWRGALSFGLGYPLVVIPLILVISLMGFYDLAEASPIAMMIPLGVLGLIFGAISGLALGLLTVGRQAWRVAFWGAVGFGLGGAGLGQGLFGYLLQQQDMRAARWSLFVGLVMFGVVGGAALGYIYSWLAHRTPRRSIPTRFIDWFKQQSRVRQVLAVIGLIVLGLGLRALWLISPFTSFSAPLESSLESKTIDTHWVQMATSIQNAQQPAVTTDVSGAPVIAWAEDNDIYYLDEQTPLNVSNSGQPSTHPQIAGDDSGNSHLIWVETSNTASEIFYSRCRAATCTTPVQLSNPPECLPNPSLENAEPALAISTDSTTLIAVWRNGTDNLLYTHWPAAEAPPATPTGCVPAGNANRPRLAAGIDNTVSLVFNRNNELYLTRFANNSWAAEPELIGSGSHPEMSIGADGGEHVVWCGPNSEVNYWASAPGKPSEKIPASHCTGRAAVAVNRNGVPRLVWYSNQLKNANGVINPNHLLVESFQTAQGWTEPAIVAQSAGSTQPVIATNDEDVLHLAWTAAGELPSALHYAVYTAYDCRNVELSGPAQAIFDVNRQAKYRPASDPIPYCYNHFDRLMYAPNPLPAYSEVNPTPNGTFDKFAELAKTAHYEVVFATMWYDSFKDEVNPGRVLGGAIAELYQNLQADPARYPRGITVRILLGNPPKFAFLPTLNSQLAALVEDLHAAGVPELRNDALGWNVEVAQYSGSWPHSHTKLMVVDGKTVQSVGYNMQHTHLPVDHPSGKGKGRADLGLQITGPVAQSSLRAFDDLWQASTRLDCANSDLNSKIWMFSCQAVRSTANHVPEVLRYYIPGGTANAFTLFRTEKFSEGDEAHYQALASAQETLDIIHINFSLETICGLNILIEACNYANRVEYMDALMQAIDQNDVQARILVSDIAWVGIENNIAIKAFEDELAARGLSDNVEIRYFEQDMHIKSALIDNEFLIVGNQNYHYSAWGGKGSLAEFNVGIEDPEAVEKYQTFFNYYWDRAKRRE